MDDGDRRLVTRAGARLAAAPLESERVLSALAIDLIRLPLDDLDAGLHRALARLGATAAADRSYLLELDPDGERIARVIEWAAPGVASDAARLVGAPLAAFAWVAPPLLAGDDVAVADVERLPAEAGAEQAEARAQGTRSFCMVPVVSGDRTLGALGFDAVHAPRAWSPDDLALLRRGAAMFRNAIERRTLESQVRHQRDFLQQLAPLATEFITLASDRIDDGIARALAVIGSAAGTDRAFVGLRDPEPAPGLGTTNSVMHEWCAEGIASVRADWQRVPEVRSPWFFGVLAVGGDYVYPREDAPVPVGATERATLEAAGVQSLLCVALRPGGRPAGFLGVVTVHTPRRWTAEDAALLHLAAEMVASALERRRLEQERARLEAQMRHAQKLESLGVLAGGIAHDFNNLLTTMLGNASLALEALPDDARARHSLEQVRLAAERARDLTNQMLAYAGRGRVQVESLDLSAVVREMAELLRVSVGRRTRLEFGLAPDLPPVAADVTQVRQVVMNLLTNAAEALPDSGGTVTVRTGTTTVGPETLDGRWVPADPSPGSYVLLQVTDTGSGMDDATRARIFEPFFSTKFAGRGLGLAAVLGIAQSHGGALRVTSGPGRGTEIAMVWPLAPRAEAVARAPEGPEAPAHGEGTVLVIDDDEGVRRVARDTLQRAGYSVLAAESGRAGLALYRMHAAEIVAVILDLEMPDLDGVGTLAELVQVRADAPVVLSSGYTERDARSRFGGTPLRGFLQKPYTAARLRAAVVEAARGVAGPG